MIRRLMAQSANLRWRRLRPLLTVCIVLGVVFSTFPSPTISAAPAAPAAAPAQENGQAKIAPLVLEQLQAAGQAEYFIWMTEQADLSAARQLPDKQAKGVYVYNTLRATAERTQKSLRAELDAAGVRYQPFYIANKIFVYGSNLQTAVAIAGRPDVARITPNRQYQLPKPIINPGAAAHTTAIEPNLTFIHADQVWAMGINGSGTVLAGNDTGVQWDHPAIIAHYRGWDGVTADHNYNWWDATGTYPNVPGDGGAHGTHTTGTMIGDDGGSNQIGVAPGAKTIHCKNMTDDGGGDDFTFTTCFQWDLAPWDLTGSNPRPDLAPDAVNNSWGYAGGNYPVFEDEVDALQAAGIVVEVSAGNEGPDCTTLRSPGDHVQALTTGSVDHSGGSLPGTMTGFSSRGPSLLDPSDFFPDVTAPGENIRSSVPGGGYEGGWSGTSMAGPHVTGLIGLMWSANPALVGMVDITYELIKQTAVPLTGQTGSDCGGDYTVGPNNDWGYGTIDALAAVNAAILFGNSGTLTGIVTNSVNGQPIAGADVYLDGEWDFTVQTDDAGVYTGVVAEGTYDVTASRYGFLPVTAQDIVITEDAVTTQNFALDPAPSYVVSGQVTDDTTGWPLFAQITINGYPGDLVWTDPVTGNYVVTLAGGTAYTFHTSAWVGGYLPDERTVGPLTADTLVDIALVADPALCSAPGYFYGADCTAPTDGGLVVGTVTNAGNGAGINGATVQNEDGYVTTTAPGGPAGDGFYTLFSPAGSKLFQASLTGYETASATVNVVANDTVRQDLALTSGWPEVNPESLGITLVHGQTGSLPFNVSNTGDASYSFEFVERPGSFIPTGGPLANAQGRRDMPGYTVAGDAAQQKTAQGLNLPAHAAGNALDAGDVLQTWPASINFAPWGVAYTADDTVWVGEGWGDNHMDAYAPDGTYVGPSFEYDWSPSSGPADFTYNANTGMVWVMDLGGDDCIHEVDPAAGMTGNTICPAWGTSQRGLAYDPETDTFYAGSWNDGMVYHFDADGNILDSFFVELPVAGLAYNPDTQHLFVVENNSPNYFWVLDTADSYNILGSFLVPGFLDYGGAGMEIGCDGSLWAVDQMQALVYQIDSGEETSWCSGDVPWLSTDPVSGTVPAQDAVNVTVNFDATVVDQPGNYMAKLTLKNDTPRGSLSVLVTMTVEPSPGWGKVQGVVNGLGVCDSTSSPLAAAEVTLQSSTGDTFAVSTDSTGAYTYWVDSAGNPYTVIAAAQNYESSQVDNVQVAGGDTVTVNLDLRLQAPCLSVEPAAITKTVELGSSAGDSLLLRNTGAGDGFFNLSAIDEGRQILTLGQQTLHAAGQLHVVNEPKTAQSSAAPGSPILSRGGPDPFGYVFSDSNEGDGPTYEWIEIAPPAGGDGIELAELTGTDDAHFFPLQLPFPFNFYGTDYEQLAVASNGTLYFEDTYMGLVNAPIPGDSGYGVQRYISPLWNDLVISPGAIYYKDLGDRFVIEYYVLSTCCTSPDSGTWQAILFDSGSILFQYQDVNFGSSDYDNGAGATVGIQGDKTTGLQYSYESPALADGLAICFAYPGGSTTCNDAGVPWLTMSPVSGTLAAGAETTIALMFDASIPEADQPGDYQAALKVSSTPPDGPSSVALTMQVTPPADWGKLTGTVQTLGACDVNLAPLADATVTISVSGGFSQSVQTNAAGGYALWAAAGSGPFTITATKSEYEMSQVGNVVLPAGGSTQTDLDLRWMRACLAADLAALEMSLNAGEQGEQTLQLTNGGAGEGRFTAREHGMTAVNAAAPAVRRMDTPGYVVQGEAALQRTAEGLNLPPHAGINSLFAGTVIQTWSPAQNPAPWGIAYTPEDTVWVGEGWGANHMDGYLPDGTYVGPSSTYAWPPGVGPADFTYNANTGKLWVMDVGGDDCIHEVDPEAGATGATICPAWDTSQRGLAFDPISNTYFAGSWNDGMVYHFDESGSILDSAFVDLDVAGLAYNPDTGHLFVMESSGPTIVWVLDVANSYAVVGGFIIPGFAAYGGAGMEIGCDGSLWAVDQVQALVYQIESSESTTWCGAEIPWLSLSPASGAVAAGGEAAISVSYDTANLAPGDYTGEIAVFHNTPGNRMNTIAVTLHVTEKPTPTLTNEVVVQPDTGGVLTGPVGNQVVTLRVPSGAVSEPVTLTLQTITNTSPAGGFAVLGMGFQIEAHTLSGNPMTQFGQMLTLVFHYNDADVVGIDENTLQIFYWNEAQSAWVALPTTVNAAANTLTATMDHLTIFATLHLSTTELKLYLPSISR